MGFRRELRDDATVGKGGYHGDDDNGGGTNGNDNNKARTMTIVAAA